ncbi:hypothetical protein DPEC_G00367690 [Dallia pectoralis]|nr:hypothetical protein DPEC_G00367690 [Dallia pectoralis]
MSHLRTAHCSELLLNSTDQSAADYSSSDHSVCVCACAHPEKNNDRHGRSRSSTAAAAPAKAPKKKAAAKPKKAGPSVGELIAKAVSASKERSGVSLAALKKSLAAGGYDVEKNNSRVKLAVKSLVTKGTLVQTKGTVHPALFKLNKKATETKKPAKKAAAPKAKKVVAKKPAAAKKPKKAVAKKPAAAAKKSREEGKEAGYSQKGSQEPEKGEEARGGGQKGSQEP